MASYIGRFSVAILLAVGMRSATLAQQSLERIVVTYPSRSVASVDLYIAQDRGFFRQEGLAAEVVQVRGNIGVTALLSGDAHAINNVGTIIRAMERADLPAKVVSQSLKKNLFWLVTKPDVKSLADLKGKVFGTTTLGGSQHLAAVLTESRLGSRQGHYRHDRRRCSVATSESVSWRDPSRGPFTADRYRGSR